MEFFDVKKKDIIYYARVHETIGIFEVLELKVRTVDSRYIVGVDKGSQVSFIVLRNDWNKIAFANREDALKIVLEREEKYKVNCKDN